MRGGGGLERPSGASTRTAPNAPRSLWFEGRTAVRSPVRSISRARGAHATLEAHPPSGPSRPLSPV
eukprot:2293231-Prymnesium_polylepis.2